MKENQFQHRLIQKIRDRFPGCIILKNDSSYLQGIPDLTIFFGRFWATLECKAHAKAMTRPNQKYYVDKMNEMSFSSFIYPENEEEILDEMERSFQRDA